MNDSKIYRKQALESFHARDEFQQAIHILSPKSWIYLFIFALLFFIGFIWLIFGHISTLVQGQGIILAKNSEIINVMSPIAGGYVKQLLIAPGQNVKKGQLLATLINPNMSGDILELKNYIKEQKMKLDELKITAKKEIDISLSRIKESINYAITINTNLQEKKKHLEELLKIQEAAFKKGILSRLELNDMQVAFYDAKEQITKNQNALVELNQKKNDYIESWNTKIRDLQQKLEQSQYNLQKLSEHLELTETIISPVSGIISNNYVKQGDFITEKQTLTNIVTNANDLEVVAFFDADIGKKIKVGMPAKIFPKHINILEYGGMFGKVIYVSELPIPPKSLESLLENQKLVESFVKSGPVFKVEIALIHSKKTPTGYRWTTSSGPHEKLSIGTVANVGIMIKKERPIAVIIPVVESAKNWVINRND